MYTGNMKRSFFVGCKTTLALSVAIVFQVILPCAGWAQNSPSQMAIDSHESWDGALHAAAGHFRLPEGEARLESYQKDKKNGENTSLSQNSITVLENGYRIYSISGQEETEVYTDSLLRLQSKRQLILDPEWQKRLGFMRMETTVNDGEARWTRHSPKDKVESGNTQTEPDSLDMALMGPALTILVNAGRRAPIEATLPMGSMNVGFRFTFHETDSPREKSRSYPFPAGWEPPEERAGVLVEMQLTGAPALVWRHRQYFFFARGESAAALKLVSAWGGDPKWPSIQRVAGP